jgi:hypothetical protein
VRRALSFPAIATTCICVLAFAVVQPIFEILWRYPEFLSVHGLERTRLIGFAMALALLPAMLCAATVWLVARAGRRVGDLAIAAVVGLSALLTLLTPLSRIGMAAALSLAVAAIVGMASAFLFARFDAPRRGLRWGWPAAPVFLVIFLFHSSVRPLWLVGGGERRLEGAGGGARDTPVVFVVFDELPLSSLLDVDGAIDAARYPNFHRVAADGLWLRKHTTSAEWTLKSVPAMLTGRRPLAASQPTRREHPRNLFTLLQGSHELHVWEAITRLAPEGSLSGAGNPLAEILVDVGVLYAHALLPKSMRHRLPPVDKGWRGFQWFQAGRGADTNRMVRGWRDFVADIHEDGMPGLYFVHTILPHPPFLFTAAGQRHTRDGFEPSGDGDDAAVRSVDGWAAIHSHRRHLLQLGFVDSLLGELLDQLERESIYDEALVIITADHGVSFRSGIAGRIAESRNLPDILAVPPFVKLPGGERAGGQIDPGTESIDILPTIMDLLAIDPGWELDGKSLLDEELDRHTKICLGLRSIVQGSKAAASAAEATVLDKNTWFEHGLYAPGPYGALVGQELSHFALSARVDEFTIRLLRPGAQFEVEAEEILPAEVVGYISAANSRAPFPHLAVALDGVIRAVTHPYRPRKGRRDTVWSALRPDDPLVDGAHRLEIFAIEAAEGGITLTPLKSADDLPSFLGLPLGQRVVVGVDETDFRRHKPHGFERYRWTDPLASLVIPLREDEHPQSLRIKIAHAAPEGSTLRLVLDGKELFAGPVPDGGWEREFSLEGLSFDGRTRVELESSSFVRDESVEGLPQPRIFGLALAGLWLQRRSVR